MACIGMFGLPGRLRKDLKDFRYQHPLCSRSVSGPAVPENSGRNVATTTNCNHEIWLEVFENLGCRLLAEFVDLSGVSCVVYDPTLDARMRQPCRSVVLETNLIVGYVDFFHHFVDSFLVVLVEDWRKGVVREIRRIRYVLCRGNITSSNALGQGQRRRLGLGQKKKFPSRPEAAASLDFSGHRRPRRDSEVPVSTLQCGPRAELGTVVAPFSRYAPLKVCNFAMHL